MKTLLVAINAKFTHTNLAVRSIAGYCNARGVATGFAEFTINQSFDSILRALYLQKADVYIFSSYIWNIELVERLGAELHKLLPTAVLAAGGPQVSYNAVEFLRAQPAFSHIIAGEGEAAVLAFLQALGSSKALPPIYSAGAALALDELPFPYPDMDALQGRILYYESMRGCPFGCSYCLSSVEKGVRYKSDDLVFSELQRFLDHRPRQVKFVDRTFNCNPARARRIWAFLLERDNGYTNFHFELAGHLLDEQSIALLHTARQGLFQFEIGVQSTNTDTLAMINRPATSPFAQIEELRAADNLHIHLDLIAGLPGEDYFSFAKSFNAVYAARPHQLQLGFLKLLPGSGLAADAQRLGITAQSHAPFEVLCTQQLRYDELLALKDIDAMVDLYHNSGRFSHTAAALCAAFPTPFGFYESLAQFYREQGCFEQPPSKLGQYELLGQFAQKHGLLNERLEWLCRYDMALHEKIKAVPRWVTVDGALRHRVQALAFYADEANMRHYLPAYTSREPKQLLKMAHIEVFPFRPDTGAEGEQALLFDYTCRDITGKACVQAITLPATP